MLFDRPSPSDLALNDYWNALNANAPGDELERLAAAVEPTELAALHRARVSKQRFSPDPLFVRRLEDTLMTISATLAAGSIPQGQTGSTGKRVDILDRGRIARPSTGRTVTWTPSRAVAFIAVAAILLSIVAGIWLASRPNDDLNIIQPAGTPIVETTPDDGSNFPLHRGNSGRTGVVNAPGPSGSPVELWTLTGLPAAFSWSAAIVDGVLYAGGGIDGLIAIDAQTGERLWNFQTEFPVDSGPAVSHGLVFFADTEGKLFAVDLGSRLERWSLPGMPSNSSPAIVGDLLYVATPEGTLYALSVETGETVWEAELGSQSVGQPAVAEGIAIQNGGDHTVHAFNALTGEPLWSFAGGVGGGMATPTIAHGVVYATTDGESNNMYALNASTGELIWQIDREVGQAFIGATATSERVFSISEDGVLHALDASDGSEIWTYQLSAFVRTIPILAGDTLFTVDNGGFVRAISAINGTEIWSYPVVGGFLHALSVAGETVYTGTDIGNLYAITGSDSMAIGVESDTISSPTPSQEPSAAASPISSASISGSVVVDALLAGEPGTPLGMPSTLAQAPDGRIWVTDGANSRFQIFEPDGTFVEVWGEDGSDEGQFAFVRGNGDGLGAIAFAPDGSFWVADTQNARIQHFDADRNFVFAFGDRGTEPGQLFSPFGVGLDSDGNIWVNDDRRGRLIKFSSEGVFLFEVGDGAEGTGRLDGQSVMRIAPDDSVWVTGATDGQMQRWSSDGTFIGSWNPSELPGNARWTSSIDFDAAGNLVILDPDGHQVIVMTPDMELIGTWSLTYADGSRLTQSFDMIVLSDGSLAVSDWGADIVLLGHLNPQATP